jgi:hypothetical protein
MRHVVIPALAALAAATLPARAQSGAPNEMMAAAVAYPLKVETLRKVMAAVADAAELSRARPEESRAFETRMQTLTSVSAMITAIDAEPLLKPILGKHGVTGRDFVLAPLAVMNAQGALMAKKANQPLPAGMSSPANLAEYEKHQAEIDGMLVKARQLQTSRP